MASPGGNNFSQGQGMYIEPINESLYQIRRPRVKIDFITDINAFSIEYDNKANATRTELVSRLESFETTNAMSDDSATFQLILFGDVFWDKVLSSNDIIKIYIDENTDDKENYHLILNGMVSQVSIVGDHTNDNMRYKIIGQSFSKPFMNFGLGIINEVNTFVPADVGWLPDDKEKGIEFTGKTSKDVMKSVIDRFVKYMKYNYDKGSNKDKSLKDQFEYSLNSWDAYESLEDATSLTNFDGNFKQMLDLITCKPFNELFFRNGDNHKSELVLRRTPFDPSDWRALPYTKVSSDELIAEDVGKSDLESYAVFNVSTPQQNKALNENLISKPQTHVALRNRYGYKKLEAEYLFLPIKDATDDNENLDEGNHSDKGNKEVTYTDLIHVLEDLGQERVAKQKDGVKSRLASEYRGVDKKQAKKIVDAYAQKGNLTKDEFKTITKLDPNKKPGQDSENKYPKADKIKQYITTNFPSSDFKKYKDGKKLSEGLKKEYPMLTASQIKDIKTMYIDKKGKLSDNDYKSLEDKFKQRAINAQETGASSSENVFSLFSKKLFNWYHANQNFQQGKIIVIGRSDYDLGKRFILENKQTKVNWEYYIESVEHSFSLEDGYRTTLGVTRGLRLTDKDTPETGSSFRFGMLWGQSTDFIGGYLGEKSLTDMKKEGVEEKKKNMESSINGGSDGDSDSGGDGEHSGGTLAGLKKYKGKLPTPRNKKDTNWTASGNPNTGWSKNECTWYVYNRRKELGLQPMAYGDAWQWLSGAKNAGFKTGKVPKQGAVIVWQRGAPGGSARYGHVAFVEKVLDGGKAYRLSEYNYNTRKGYGERTIQMDSAIGKAGAFIYDK